MLEWHTFNFSRPQSIGDIGGKIEVCDLRTTLQIWFFRLVSCIVFSINYDLKIGWWLFILLSFECPIYIKNQFFLLYFKGRCKSHYLYTIRLVNEKSESQQTALQPQRRMAFTKQVNRYNRSDYMTAAVTTVRDKETAKIKKIFLWIRT